jgi:hypothetical protein
MGKERRQKKSRPKGVDLTGVPTPSEAKRILEQLPQQIPAIQKV